jgi:hypothetical protein
MTTQNENDSFNVTIKAVGYVTKIIVRRDARKEAVKIRMNLLHGRKTATQYLPAEFFVNGEQAQGLIKDLGERFQEGDKTLLSFVGNAIPAYFVSQAEGRKGEVVPSFAGSLYFVKSIKENGAFTFRDDSHQNGGATR